MKPYIFPIIAALLSSSSFAASSVKVQMGSDPVEIQVLPNKGNGVSVEISSQGKVIQTFDNLGREFSKVGFNGGNSTFLALDFDSDGYKEFILRTSLPPLIGALWVFKWDKSKKAFAMLKTETGDNFIPVPVSDAVEVAKDGSFKFSTPTFETISYRWDGKTYKQK